MAGFIAIQMTLSNVENIQSRWLVLLRWLDAELAGHHGEGVSGQVDQDLAEAKALVAGGI